MLKPELFDLVGASVRGKLEFPSSHGVCCSVQMLAIEQEPAPGELLERECSLRVWRRKCLFCFVRADAPNGESEFQIVFELLGIALEKVVIASD